VGEQERIEIAVDVEHAQDGGVLGHGQSVAPCGPAVRGPRSKTG
jgi:hypothetical protein